MLMEGANAVRCDGQLDKTFHKGGSVLNFLTRFFSKNY
jgi:hypothetical protein